MSPSSVHRAAVLGPTPGIAERASPARKPASHPARTSINPRGLAWSEASLAIIRLGPIPMLQSSPVAARTASRIVSATGSSDTG